MKKIYVTTMPDEAGAFLKASICFAKLNINITRVSYNKSVDIHTLFIEAEGEEAQFAKADSELAEIGYISNASKRGNVILMEFRLDDKPGELVKVLELIKKYRFNISYISSHENGLGYQPFRMGLFVDDDEMFLKFYLEAKELCPVSVIDYDNMTVNFDNSVFYQTYVDNLIKNAGISENVKAKLTVNVNRAMQLLDERNLPPKTTFDCIAKFATLLSKYKGENFNPRVTTYDITPQTQITVIEPPCGSNTTIIKSNGKFLFVDSGYSLYKNEMIELFNKITGGFEKIDKSVLVTHADVDHTGLLYLFDEIYASDKSKECLELDYQNKRGFREQNPLHIPYIRICKILTSHQTPNPQKINVICQSNDEITEPLYKSGTFTFGELTFDVYSGQGGHLQGEIVLVDSEHKLIFSGDVYVNIRGYSPEQAEYNQYAPVLMTSVDTNPILAKLERNSLLKIASHKGWRIFSGHGEVKEV